ncbi:MAG: hypothetical protein ACFFDK_01670 [Promethearchaeota archaeon]
MFQPIPFSRIIQVFIIFLGGGIFFLVLSFLILRKNKHRLNLTICGFFIFIFLGGLFNAIYVILTTQVDESVVVALHIITYIFFCLAQIFLLMFNLILWKSEKLFTIKKQLIILGIYCALLFVLFFIPEGVRINESTYYRPQWNLQFFIYANIVWIGYAVIPTLYTSIKLYQAFEDPKIKKRWKIYVIGMIMIYVELFGVGVMILINDPFLRAVWNIYDVCVLIGAFLIYYGVVRQL